MNFLEQFRSACILWCYCYADVDCVDADGLLCLPFYWNLYRTHEKTRSELLEAMYVI